jgi:NAD(P)-dependent dehydrogenase (short-subunit alcohol dehydrogenase family)
MEAHMLEGKTAVVVGASRGLGRGIAEALSASGAQVVAIGRDGAALDELRAAHPSIVARAADARDPAVAADVLSAHDPGLLAVVAGATPVMKPIHHHTWESFSRPWEVDLRIAFHWLREALSKPLRPGSQVVLMSSGAATNGSPLSGGYAGAKSTIRFMAAYADDEARREGLGIRVSAVLPKLTGATSLGLYAVRAYAQRHGIGVEQFVEGLGTPLTPEVAGRAFLSLAGDRSADRAVAYALTGDGFSELPAA